MKERIFGTECEYGLFYHSDNKDTIASLFGEKLLDYQKKLASILFSTLTPSGRNVTDLFMTNGGRIYIDRGGHPEYATPECRSVKDLVAHEKAGDRTIQELVRSVRSDELEQNGNQKIHMFKNNVDSYGNTYGGHENYLITSSAMSKIQAILPFLVTRQIYCGAGKISSSANSGRYPYQISQRSDFIQKVFSDRTSGERGIINIRKREIVKPDQNLRLHIIFGDSNMAEYAIGLKIGTTSLILRLLEEGGLDKGIPMLAAPVEAFRQISHQWNEPINIEDSEKRYSALDIQMIYFDNAQKFYAVHGDSAEEKQNLDLWGNVLQHLKRLKYSPETGIIHDDPGELKRTLDWVCKLWLLNRYQRQKNMDWNDFRLKTIDLMYHDIDPEAGLFERCQRLNMVDRLVDDSAIAHARSNPPADTRANIRGMILKEAVGKNIEVQAKGWDRMLIRATRTMIHRTHEFDRHRQIANTMKINLDDPFQNENPKAMEALKQFIETWN